MNERIHFPESKIPEVVAIIRAGLKSEYAPKDCVKQLERQCDDLMAYWQRMQRNG